MGLDYTKNKQAFGQTKQRVSAFGKDYEYQSARNNRRKNARSSKSSGYKRPLTKEERNSQELYHKICSAYKQFTSIPELKYLKLDPRIEGDYYIEKYNLKRGEQYEFLGYYNQYSWGAGEVQIRIKSEIVNVSHGVFIPTEPTEEDVIMYIMRKEIR